METSHHIKSSFPFSLSLSLMDTHNDPFLVSPHLFMLADDHHSINSIPAHSEISPSSPSGHRKKYEGFGDMIDDEDDDLKMSVLASGPVGTHDVEYDPYKSFTLHDLDADPGTASPLNDMDDDDIISVHEDKMSISDADTDVDDNCDAHSTHAQASTSVSPPPAAKEPMGRTLPHGKAAVYVSEDDEEEDDEPALSNRDDDDSDFSAIESDTQDDDDDIEDDDDTDGSYGRPSTKKRRGSTTRRPSSTTPRRNSTSKLSPGSSSPNDDVSTTDLTTLFATHTPASLARLAKIEYSDSRTKLYICPVPSCSRPFTRRFNLATHTQTHDPAPPPPFACPKCTRTFVREHDLARHATVHAQSKHHACPSCNTRFSRRDALRRHLARRGECRGFEGGAGVVGEARRGRRKVGERGVVKTEREILWEDPVARGVIESAVRTQEELAKKIKKEK